MILTIITIFVVLYIVIGVLKLKYFDLNGEGDWLLMWSDSRSRRSPVVYLFICLVICWLTWPIILFSRNKYKIVDEEVIADGKDETGQPKAKLVKLVKNAKCLSLKGSILLQ